MTTIPTLTDVTSSNIKALGHDGDSNLFVQFKSDPSNVWRYGPVTPEQFETMKSAESIGTHFHANIKRTMAGEKMPMPAASSE